MQILVPRRSLVVLVGAAGAGKSTFAASHFRQTQIISSDFCRGLVSDDENDLSASADAFEVLNLIAGKRLARGRLTVIDATSVQPQARRSLVNLARAHHRPAVAIVLDLPLHVIKDRNRKRTDRRIPEAAVERQADHLRKSRESLAGEGFRSVYVLRTVEDVDAVTIERR
jgi:protein phosphatase